MLYSKYCVISVLRHIPPPWVLAIFYIFSGKFVTRSTFMPKADAEKYPQNYVRLKLDKMGIVGKVSSPWFQIYVYSNTSPLFWICFYLFVDREQYNFWFKVQTNKKNITIWLQNGQFCPKQFDGGKLWKGKGFIYFILSVLFFSISSVLFFTSNTHGSQFDLTSFFKKPT